jgi:hypothetical protein
MSPSIVFLPQKPKLLHLHECNACTNSFPAADLISLFCEHRYCRDCVQRMFSESLTGPQCCQEPITLAAARPFLSANLVQRYQAKEVEHNTPNKVYCSRPQCSELILPELVGPDRAYCPGCGTETCTQCKATAHRGVCSADPGLQHVLELGRLNGWQSCPKCNHLIELTKYCNHITFVSNPILEN